jgi:YggT family protein
LTDIAGILNLLFTVLTIAIIARALLSWFDPMMRHGISQVLVDVTEPIIAPIRRVIPPIGGTLDISPIVALVLLQVVERVILRSLTS